MLRIVVERLCTKQPHERFNAISLEGQKVLEDSSCIKNNLREVTRVKISLQALELLTFKA